MIIFSFQSFLKHLSDYLSGYLISFVTLIRSLIYQRANFVMLYIYKILAFPSQIQHINAGLISKKLHINR